MPLRSLPLAPTWAVLMAVGLSALTTACSTISPPPPPSTALPQVPSVAYTCADGSLLRVQFGNETAAVTLPDGNTANLPQQRAASGIWYASPQYTLRGKGDEATWTIGRRMPLECRVQR